MCRFTQGLQLKSKIWRISLRVHCSHTFFLFISFYPPNAMSNKSTLWEEVHTEAACVFATKARDIIEKKWNLELEIRYGVEKLVVYMCLCIAYKKRTKQIHLSMMRVLYYESIVYYITWSNNLLQFLPFHRNIFVPFCYCSGK